MASKRRLARSALVARLALGGALVMTLASPTRPAYAEPNATEKDTARQLMADGRQKRDNKDLKGALKSFETADAIMKVPSTGWEVARTQELLGLWIEARDNALRVLRIPEAKGEPPAFQDARTKAQALFDNLETRIPFVSVTVKGAPEGATLTVTINAISVPGAALAAPIRLNPGHHVISVKTDAAAGSQEIDVVEKDKKDVTITLAPTATAPPPTPTETETPPEAPPPPPPEPKHTMRTVAFVGFGVGGVGLIAGVVTGFLTLSAKSSALNGCRDNRCPPSTFSDLDTASTMSTISTVSFIVAGIGAGVGITALVIGDKPAAPPPTGARITPWIGLGSAGVRGSF